MGSAWLIRLTILAGAGLVVAAGGLVITRPQRIEPSRLAGFSADLANGAYLFDAAGCASCHAAPKAEGPERFKLGGGRRLATPFGTFHVPNISPDRRTGIGTWTVAEIVDAIAAGVGRDGSHQYPAMPYASYGRMSLADAHDLAAFLKTLPAVENEVPPHELGFPFGIRLGIGLWKLVNFNPGPVVALPAATPEVLRGRYLVEGPGHCGECHTPRDAGGGTLRSRWLAGAPAMEGPGRVPDLTPHPKALGPWSVADITGYLETGFKPDGDTAGGPMVEVIDNTARLTPEDRRAIALYLKAVPAIAPEPRPVTVK
ncbi:c-type cytochrome [Siculibacillus lacustris]|uniref:C-type cytochrome n=1 Tax=Siculibacillus lacustris TaxID=1549641 RepID=A0A4V2KSV9_9HYPH|nr:cytochrome c [Siculibacillus lacustris]TBW34615.1 c-type cytochrome [Siculibacillus lacustris]